MGRGKEWLQWWTARSWKMVRVALMGKVFPLVFVSMFSFTERSFRIQKDHSLEWIDPSRHWPSVDGS